MAPRFKDTEGYIKHIEAIGAELAKFWEQCQNESDRGFALTCSAHIERCLELCLIEYFRGMDEGMELLGLSGPLGGVMAKLRLCKCLGIIDEGSYDQLRTFIKIRNEFAHNYDAAFELSPVKEYANSLFEKFAPNDDRDFSLAPRAAFSWVMAGLNHKLTLRSVEVALYRLDQPEFIPKRSSNGVNK